MRRDPVTGIRILDDTVDFRDSSESRVLGILEAAGDRSSRSDELARHIRDWPTRYHFSRSRGNLLRPLEIREGMRVLDVGAGTGVVARSLAERGARVVALEGDLERARAAAARCADAEGVEVVCGSLAAYRDDGDGFDLVCFVGVLEYAGSGAGGRAGADAALEQARALLRPDGAVVVAVENQLGLKYLLGYPEDHLGLPFAGVEGYPDSGGVRTWSRRALAELLAAHGLDVQRWLFPYPDYKLPAVILADSAFDRDDAAILVDALVRRPSSETGQPRPTACDERAAHGVFLEAGLGREVANSFLVVAAPSGTSPLHLVPDDRLAWFFGRERLRSWMRTRIVLADGDGARIRTIPADGSVAERRRGWLRQCPQDEVEFAAGPTVEQLALAACRDRDLERLRAALGTWREILTDRETPREATPSAPHPFLAADARSALPADHLDLSLSNVVATGDGPVLVDREWEVRDGVEPLLAGLRALWYFAAELVADGVPHPFHPESSVDELALALAATAGLDGGDDDLQRMRAAETALQVKVTGRDSDVIADELGWIGRRHPLDGSVVRRLPFTRLQHELSRRAAAADSHPEEAARRAAEVEELRAACRRQAAELERYRKGNDDLEKAVADLQSALERQRREAAERTAERDRARDETERYRKGNEDLERIVARHQAVSERHQEEVAELRSVIARIEQDSAHHRGVVESLRAEIDRRQRDTEELQARHDALAVRDARLESETERLEHDLASARATISDLTSDHAALDRERIGLATAADRLEGELEDARLAHQAAASEIAQLEVDRQLDRSRIADLESRLADLQQRLHDAGERIRELEGEVGHWRQWRSAFERRLPVRLYRMLSSGGGDGGP